MENLTNEQLVLGGAAIGTYLTALAVYYILIVIAGFKIFTKKKKKGWKSLIPIYRWYIFYKIAKVNFWVWWFIPVILGGIVSSNNTDKPANWLVILSVVVAVYTVVAWAKFARGLAKSFGRGAGFAVGIFFLREIFLLILGFGSSKYVEKK